MLNWRMVWSSFISTVCPPLYRQWRFSHLRSFNWSELGAHSRLEPELLILPELLGKHGCFLDVGANNGDYLWAILPRKHRSEIVAVEPIPFLAGLLNRAFRGIVVRNLALTDGDGPRWLKIPDIGGRTYNTRATLNVEYREAGETNRHLIQVECATLDSFWLKLGDPPLECIKIDTEGHELSVLKGASGTLARHRPFLMVEIEQRHHQEDIGTVFGFLTGKGYRCFHFDSGLREVRELSANLHEVRATRPQNADARYLNNFFFLPAERSDLFDRVDRINQRLAPAVQAA